MNDWTQTRTTGRGSVDYRLVVAGWPHEWTTSGRLQHFSGRAGRNVYPSLQYDGLRITERASVRDAWTEVQGITFTINPCTPFEETVGGFTRDAIPIGYLSNFPNPLGGSVGDIDTVGFSNLLVLDTAQQLSAGMYHIGTEAMRSDGGNSMARAQWNTVSEVHRALPGPVAVYDWPPTMEGRRCYLYAYEDADDAFGDGKQIWVGVVAAPPKMQSDGVSWTIEASSITEVFNQTIASAETLEYKLRGVYHSAGCPLRIETHYLYGDGFGGIPSELDELRLFGFFETQEEWVSYVNVRLATLLAAHGFAEVSSMLYEERGGAPTITLKTVFPSPNNFRAFWNQAQSALEGGLVSLTSVRNGPDGVEDLSDDMHSGDPNTGAINQAYTEFFGDGSKAFLPFGFEPVDAPPYTYPLSKIRGMLGWPRLTTAPTGVTFGGAGQAALAAGTYYANDTGANALAPPSRIYLRSVVGLSAGTVLYIKNSENLTPIVVDSVVAAVTGGGGNYIEAHTGDGTGVLYFDGNTTLVPLRSFALNATLFHFLSSVVTLSPYANDGDTPFITANDVDTLSLLDAFLMPSGIDSYWYFRNYTFLKSVAVKEVLTPELKLIGWMARLQADGRLGFTRMPLMSATRTPDATLTETNILLPGEGLFGMWPTWEAQPDGLVNVANIKLGYDPLQDEYDENLTFHVSVIESISLHKSSGKASEDIEVKSTQTTNANLALTAFDPGNTMPTSERVNKWAETYLAILSTEYAIVTVAVPFTCFDLLVGSIVDVTCTLIPNGLGGRGVVSKKAYVVGRDWNLDPRSNEMGKLTLYFPRTIGAGYTPTGRVTAQTLTAVNTWKLQFAKTNLYNDAWAERASDVSIHFAVGDAIMVISTPVGGSSTNIFGVVIAKDNTTTPDVPTVTVQLEVAWTPGALTWNLAWRRDVGTTHAPVTARQNSYCYIADATRLLVNGHYARLYV